MNTHTPPPTQVTRLMLRLPPDLAERLRRLARAHDRSLNGELVRALRMYVEREERSESDETNTGFRDVDPGERRT